ncbi:N-acetyllactosaminide alpha-1,3-galactosyltransferase-like [Mirounga leonina]|uniref:N-acetyllactosaminide alpha-1,3-galactosyltransferase-like n=1 Tax=Mirounga leonina TaxID=9715 RepID=UPI00156BF9CF|nr:N-acetyllactosaminide alpha-1,3-galactosyltransferase-like [Mirounga leonina]
MKFCDHVSMEILSPLFGTLHPGFYQAAHKDFSYEHWPQSQAHIPRDKGDFYYMRTFFAGSVVEVHQLTLACHQAMGVNLATGIEAVWHNESHLNRYLLDHKPIKVLSPEDPWDPQLLGCPREDLWDPQLLGCPWRTCGIHSCWAVPHHEEAEIHGCAQESPGHQQWLLLVESFWCPPGLSLELTDEPEGRTSSVRKYRRRSEWRWAKASLTQRAGEPRASSTHLALLMDSSCLALSSVLLMNWSSSK